MRNPSANVLLLACYELGHAPLSLAWPLAFLEAAGYGAEAVDLSVQRLPETSAASAKFVGIAAPMHTALRLGVKVAARVRQLNPYGHICFYGLYAWLNADYLLSKGLADSVIGGEYEQPLAELVDAVCRGKKPGDVPGVSTAESRNEPYLGRLRFPIPRRSDLPPLDQYARYTHAGGAHLAGYVEASRGCLHTCHHCPIVPVYGGRFFTMPLEIVMADIRQQAAAGAAHITFGDPDFLNGPGHALRLARVLHAEFPGMTFDFTTKVEHVLKHARLFTEFAQAGCTFVVSAIESVSDAVLAHLNKGHTATDIVKALSVLDAAGIALHPTLVAFTPWTSLEAYVAQVEFIRQQGLVQHLPPIQLAIRLLVPPRSKLLSAPDAPSWLRELDAEALTYRWVHPDPRMDKLYEAVMARVELAEQTGEDPAKTHAWIRRPAFDALGGAAPPRM